MANGVGSRCTFLSVALDLVWAGSRMPANKALSGACIRPSGRYEGTVFVAAAPGARDSRH